MWKKYKWFFITFIAYMLGFYLMVFVAAARAQNIIELEQELKQTRSELELMTRVSMACARDRAYD